jgi:hypothetical protein
MRFMRPHTRRVLLSTGAAFGALGLGVGGWPLSAASSLVQRPTAGPCRIEGVVSSGGTPLPGVTVTVRQGERVVWTTSTDVEGSYSVGLALGEYAVAAELSAFAPATAAVTFGDASCTTSLNLELRLASRAGTPVDVVTTAPAPAAGQAGPTPGPPQRFQSLAVTETASAPTATAAADTTELTSFNPEDDPAARLLPPGFSPDAAVESVAVSGSLVQLDRGQMNDRMQALQRGDFALGDPAAPGLVQGIGGRGGAGGGPADALGGGGRGGFGGIGGRGGGNRLQATATYGLGGSMFDAAPYALRGEPVQQRDYLQQNLSTTIGGPVRLPGLYNGTGRTSFNFSYTTARNENLFDQYATVPNEAFRGGDFSSSSTPILDPSIGAPFENNQIPLSRMSPAALALLRYIPEPNLSGDTRNFHRVDTSQSTTNTYSLRITHTLTQPVTGRGGRGGAGAGGGRAGGAGGGAGPQGGAGPGRGGRGAFQAPLNITMNATVNYRRNDGDRPNVFPLLSGATEGSTVSVPVTLNVRHGRLTHAINASFNRTRSSTLNAFAFDTDVTGLAGIGGVATDPFDWGVPSLTFSAFSAVRDIAPSRRTDRSWQLSYGLTRPAGTHTFRLGGSYSSQLNRTQSDSNARGTFTFTGLYTAGGPGTVRGSGQDFADFLLGLPQQATRQYSVTLDEVSAPVIIHGWQASAYFQDDWRLRPRWTVNYGVQYNFLAPYSEVNGRMVNLDAAPDFSAVDPVMPGETGPYSGQFPSTLVKADWNNVAPRVGVAWRANNRTVVRFGYGLTYNSGSYSAIARNLYQQPPFFQTGTSLGTLDQPLTLTDPFANITPGTVTNSYGIDTDYQLGLIHQWNVDVSRDLNRMWVAGATYIGTGGSQLDMLRAPNRGPEGLRLEDVQSFTWQSAEGSSRMHGVSLRLQKRQSRGISGSVSYTLSRSRDNTTATGGGATVAQDDRNLDAEWGLSSFDRRHQLSGNANVELPWGRGRQWLNEGGWLAALVGDWSVAANLTVQSGSPLTPRCSSCASDVARGVGGTLRANYTGDPIQLDNPTIDQFFNTAAFTVPSPGTFGNAPRNIIIGPGSRQLNAQISRDVLFGGNRGLTITVNATNLMNLVNYSGVDTNVNSPTFGQVLSVTGRRSVRLNVRFRF